MELTELKDRMQNGKLYFPNEEELMKEQMTSLDKLFLYNSLPPSAIEKKQALLKEMFAEIGEHCYLETPFYANWGGKFVHFGSHVYANFHLTLVDDGRIDVGDHVMFGPHVTLCTASHPIHPLLRRQEAQYNLPVTIGNNVWIGANSTVLPGVRIGDNSVIGAGSVVTRDIPANVVAVGSPCRVLREIDEHDMRYYHKQFPIDLAPKEE